MDPILLVFCVVPIFGGSLSSLVSMKSGKASFRVWYDRVQKAPWNPPTWLFGPAWTMLYGLMGVASYVVFQSGSPYRTFALTVYMVQLFVNYSWSPLFFGLRKFRAALWILMLLWVLIICTMYLFFKVAAITALMLTPYICWVTFAFTLNWYIVQYNDERLFSSLS